ncbi:adenylate/guanylate cyclase domain-containing protein [Hoeflea sp. TYP-13]|uniref:adenylate/guanylate cyclase domain-containing protein n=1 Tax=Hoeflea sp. TYP-13 TaxID=3230023 RepID=UPI0034C62C60
MADNKSTIIEVKITFNVGVFCLNTLFLFQFDCRIRVVTTGVNELTAPLSLHRAKIDWRLSALAFADVAGYSRLMAKDGAATVALWSRLRDEVLFPHLERHSGRLVESPGDAVLVEFPGAVSAVSWAVDVQQSVLENQGKSMSPDALSLRIGINVDDVIDEEGALYSDGVNIASRIHQFAKPGEIVLTGTVRDLIGNRLPNSYRYLGAPTLKNIERPVHIYAVEAQQPNVTRQVVSPYLNWSSRPTLAVLPFRNIDESDNNRYFGEGITEDIIAGVARSRTLFVIARSSTLQFTDASKDPQKVANALGVKYLLTGSVRRQSNHLRINAELVEVEHSRTAWAERYDGETEDLFEFQDKIVSSIVAALEPHVRAAETARIGNRPTESLDAYDCVLRALADLYQFTFDSYAESRSLLERAVKLDPGYAQAHAYLAWCLVFWIGEGHSRDIEADRAEALAAARKAVELDPEDAVCLSVGGHVMAFIEGKPSGAVELFQQALERDENSPLAWGLSATCFAYLGNGDEARKRLRNVWRLAPYDPHNFFFWTAAGIGEFVAGRYEDAIGWLRKSYRVKPQLVATLRLLAATLALKGDIEEAHSIASELLAAEPSFKISDFMAWYPLQREEDRDKLTEGLRKANLPK